MKRILWNHLLLLIVIMTGAFIFLTSCKKEKINYGTVADIEGNSYKTIKIGNQWWMAENLKTTKYNDGTDIPNLTGIHDWDYFVTTPEFCWYDNNINNSQTYGAIYNWYTVSTDMLCPLGWHVPTDAEWTTLIDYEGGASIAGNKLKETGTLHWLSPNTGATNESGFTALPGGSRAYADPGYYSGLSFHCIGENSSWWSATEYSEQVLVNSRDTSQAWIYSMFTYSGKVERWHGLKVFGCYVRCVKDNFTTKTATLPSLTTSTVISITSTTATCGGKITDDGGAIVIARGVCWSTSEDPTIVLSTKTINGTGRGSFTSSLTGLIANTTYFVRSYATNSVGTAYGTQVSFTTSTGQTGIVSDIEGNIYNTVTIGTQVWMVENLKTTKYNDGTDIPLVTDNSVWASLSTPAYCWYNNDAATYKTAYGALYNWYAVSATTNGLKNICPINWHVPTDDEWKTLTTFWGGSGGKLKEIGTLHWLSPNTGATNESGFTARPGGYRLYYTTFINVGEYGYWWSATDNGTAFAWLWFLCYKNSDVYVGESFKNNGVSVRCLRD